MTCPILPPTNCVFGGLADFVFDGTPWRFLGTYTDLRVEPPMTETVDRTMVLERFGTGCNQFKIDSYRVLYVDDTYVSRHQVPRQDVVAGHNLTICQRPADGALTFKSDLFFSTGIVTTEEGVLTRP